MLLDVISDHCLWRPGRATCNMGLLQCIDGAMCDGCGCWCQECLMSMTDGHEPVMTGNFEILLFHIV